MAITLWKDKKSPWGLLESMKKEMDEWFEERFGKRERLAKGESIFDNRGMIKVPVVDIQEKEDAYVVHAELPGIKKDETSVEYRDGVLTIKGEKKFEHEENKKDFHRIERSYGSFHRSFQILEAIDEDRIKGEYKNGVLELTLPIKEPEKRKAKKIVIE
jgi:HSP20 family protein